MLVACNLVKLKLTMNKAWDGNSIREYVSCMKINGVPLLPPIMTEECRKEMQYYKLLAMAVEKRLADLAFLNKEKYLTSESSPNAVTSPSENEALNIPEKEEKNIDEQEPLPNGFESILSDVTVIDNVKDLNDKAECLSNQKTSIFNHSQRNTEFATDKTRSPNRLSSPNHNSQIDRYMPAERNLDCIESKTEDKKILQTKKIPIATRNLENYAKRGKKFNDEKENEREKALLGTKTLSGSLNDISFESSQPYPKLVRQRSYTIENPSPMLLAHLEVQYVTSGIDMSSISMSESCSNIPSESKKRRSWDLVTAKMKWSSMATELNTEKVSNQATHKTDERMPKKRMMKSHKSPGVRHNNLSDKNRLIAGKENTNPSELQTTSIDLPLFNIYVSQEKTPPKRIPTVIRNRNERDVRSECSQKPHSKSLVHSASKNIPSRNTQSESSKPHRDFSAKLSMITTPQTTESKTATNLASNTMAPNTWDACINDLYKRIQNQQLLQMKILIDKQKREQLHLQKSFEEQTGTFFKQIKNMYPELTIEGNAIVDDRLKGDNDNSDELSLNGNKISSMTVSINETDRYIQLTDEVLKRSRNVLDSVKKLSPKQTIIRSETMTLARDTTVTEVTIRDKSYSGRKDNIATKTFECNSKLTPLSRCRMSSGTSSQSSQGVQDEIILTDRTNDTFADLNFTLSNDTTDEANSRSEDNTTDSGQHCSSTTIHKKNKIHSPRINGKSCSSPMQRPDSRELDSNSSLRDYCVIPDNNSGKEHERKSSRRLFSDHAATKTEKDAASKIVAYAKGYLVRRLLKTERVQSTVQTIRDALVCALQLHQDREGIRGADIDLHRRLIQQITAACYTLHDTFINSTVTERCQYIAQDRERKRALQVRQGSANSSLSQKSLSASKKLAKRKMDIMSHSHLGVFTTRSARSVPSHAMSNSSYETLNTDTKMYLQTSRKYLHSTKELHNRRPWR